MDFYASFEFFFSQLPSVFLLPATLRDDPYLFGTGVETPVVGDCANLALTGVQTFCTAWHNLLERESAIETTCRLMSTEMWCCGLYLPDRRSAPPPLTHTKVYCMTPVSHSVSQSRFLNTHALSSNAPFALVWSALVVSRFFFPTIYWNVLR